MANAVQHALNEIGHRIPAPILQEAFVSPLMRDDAWARRHSAVVSIDHVIRDKVIQKRVIPHINLTTGQRVLIPLNNVLQEYQDDMTMVMRIPKASTRGVAITSVYAIVAGSPIGTLGGNIVSNAGSGTDLIDALSGMRQSRGPIPMVSDANIQLIGENTILLSAPVRQNGFLYLDCMIENDRILSHLPPAAYECFAKLCEYAVKAYIFNNVAIPMDQAQIAGGMAIGRFRDLVDRMEDANDLFDEQLKIWKKVYIMTDPLEQRTFIQGVVGGLF